LPSIVTQTGRVNLTKIAHLNFTVLDTSCDVSNNERCDYDWIEIRSNRFDVGGPRYCCNKLLFEISTNSTDTELIVLFYSTHLSNEQHYGFNALITFTQSEKRNLNFNFSNYFKFI
jgi:hypothetical protein